MIPVTAEKKDPGKFTVRFNPEDPQQRTVIRVLNRQGRYKAQFLTSAVLHYIRCKRAADGDVASGPDTEMVERIVRDVLARQGASLQDRKAETAAVEKDEPSIGEALDGMDRAAIFRTLSAFRGQ